MGLPTYHRIQDNPSRNFAALNDLIYFLNLSNYCGQAFSGRKTLDLDYVSLKDSLYSCTLKISHLIADGKKFIKLWTTEIKLH